MTRTAKNSTRLLNDTSSDQENEMQGLEQQPSTSKCDWYQPCTYHTQNVLRWIGQSTMACIKGTRNGSLSVKTFQIVSFQCSLIQKSARKLQHGVMTLIWISMFPGACQLVNLTWRQFGLNMKNCASPKSMKCEQGLTCLQDFARTIDQWMNGTMLYKLKCVLLSIHKKLQLSCTVISFVFFP